MCALAPVHGILLRQTEQTKTLCMPLISIHCQVCMDVSVSKSEGVGESAVFLERAKEGLLHQLHRDNCICEMLMKLLPGTQRTKLLIHYRRHGSCHLVTLELTITGPISDSSISQDGLAREIISPTNHLPDAAYRKSGFRKNTVGFRGVKGQQPLYIPHVPSQIASFPLVPLTQINVKGSSILRSMPLN